MPSEHLDHSICHLIGVGVAAEIASQNLAFRGRLLDRLHNALGGLFLAEVLQHHRARPDRPYRIGQALASDIGRAAVHRLKEGWVRLGRPPDWRLEAAQGFP